MLCSARCRAVDGKIVGKFVVPPLLSLSVNISLSLLLGTDSQYRQTVIMDNPPQQTLYVNNLNDRIPKNDLRKTLYGLFGQFGSILDVVALKTTRMRGQAFIVFADISGATKALRSVQGFVLCGKPMRISYAKEKSHAVLREEQAGGLPSSGSTGGGDGGRYGGGFGLASAAGEFGQKSSSSSSSSGSSSNGGGGGGGNSSANPPSAKRARLSEATNGNGFGVEGEGKQGEEEGEERENSNSSSSSSAPAPHNVLYLSNLPAETTTADMLRVLFEEFPGVSDVRLVPGRADIAFVEFSATSQAAVAMEGLQGFKIDPQHAMTIAYAAH